MARLCWSDGSFHIRFRYRGQAFKRALKTAKRNDAQAAQRIVELTLYRLTTGQTTIPPQVDPGEFIVSGGTVQHTPSVQQPAPPTPSVQAMIEQYLVSERPRMAPSYYDSQVIHLRHSTRFLGARAKQPCDQIQFRDLDKILSQRLATRHALTLERERITVRQFFQWIVRQGFLTHSPAASLQPIKGGEDRPPFRTVEEIDRIIARGGLSVSDSQDLRECLYLNLREIADLLVLVKAQAEAEFIYLMHAIPADTGMRRGEVLRLRWLDVNLEAGFVFARSLKQSRRKRETVRRIDLHPE